MPNEIQGPMRNPIAKIKTQVKRVAIKVGIISLASIGAAYIFGIPAVMLSPIAFLSGVAVGHIEARRGDK